MFTLRRFAVLTGLLFLASSAVAGIASAADERITLKNRVKPRHGKFFKQVRRPARMSLRVKVHTPASSPTVNPLKRARMHFPKDLTYNPNNRRTPVCGDRKLSEQSNLAVGIAATVDRCPKSVIGTGTAAIYLAKVHLPNALIDDPQMVIFNAGKNRKGNPRMKIYAYSAETNVGILMRGSLNRRGVQDVRIPVLSSDSAAARFVLRIPGPAMEVPDPDAPGGTRKIKGRDPAYARARCSRGKWTTRGTFTLGERTYPGGVDTGPETVVKARPFTSQCFGRRGKPRLRKVWVKAPRVLRRGSRRVFRIRVRNRGTATARKVRVKVRGAGRGRARSARIRPGKRRTIRVKVRVRGRPGKVGRFVIRVSSRRDALRTVIRRRIAR